MKNNKWEIMIKEKREKRREIKQSYRRSFVGYRPSLEQRVPCKPRPGDVPRWYSPLTLDSNTRHQRLHENRVTSPLVAPPSDLHEPSPRGVVPHPGRFPDALRTLLLLKHAIAENTIIIH